MTDFSKQIQELRAKIERRKHLETVCKDLHNQINELRTKHSQLQSALSKEENDVAILEKGGITSFFLEMMGKKEERLDKERREAYAAKAQYESASRQLQSLEYDIGRYMQELDSLQNADEQYAALLEERTRLIEMRGIATEEDTLALQENLIFLENNHREIQEAVAAGQQAVSIAHEITFYLQKAEELLMWDILFDSILVDMQKHDWLDKAGKAAESLQLQLRKFKSELADVTIDEDFDITMDDFMTFFDFFFDGLFSSLAVNDRVKSSKIRTEETCSKIIHTLSQLENMRADNEKQQAEIRQMLKQ